MISNKDISPVKQNTEKPENKKLMDFIKNKSFQIPWNENKNFDPLAETKKDQLALNVSTGYDIPSLGEKTIQDLAEGDKDRNYKGIGKGGAAALSGGIAAIGEVPSIVANYANKPETAQERTGQILRTGASGAKIGGAIGTAFGPVGTAIGTVGGFAVGTIGGLFSQSNWKSEAREKQEEEFTKLMDDIVKKRNQFYFKTKSSADILREYNMQLQANGYPTTD